MAEKKKYIVAIRQGKHVTLVQTEDPAKSIKDLEQDHIDSLPSDQEDAQVQVEIYDGDEDPAKVKSANAADRPTPLAKSEAGNTVRLALKNSAAGDSNDVSELMAGFLERNHIDADGSTAKKDGKHKVTLKVTIKGVTHEFTAEEDSLEEALKKAREAALENPDIDEETLRNESVDRKGKRKASFEIEYEGPDHDEDDDPVHIKTNSFAAAVMGISEKTGQQELANKVLKEKNLKELKFYSIEIDGQRFVGFGYNIEQAREDAQTKKNKFEEENPKPFIASKDKHQPVKVTIGSLAQHQDPKARGAEATGDTELEALDDIESQIREKGASRNQATLDELAAARRSAQKSPMSPKGKKGIAGQAFEVATGAIPMVALGFAVKGLLAPVFAAIGIGGLPALVASALIVKLAFDVLKAGAAKLQGKSFSKELGKNLVDAKGWASFGVAAVTLGFIEAGAFEGITNAFSSASEGAVNSVQNWLFGGGEGAAGVENYEATEGSMAAESDRANGVSNLGETDWTQPQDLGQVNTEFNERGFVNGIKELEDGSQLIKTQDGKIILVETASDELSISKTGQGEVRLDGGDISIDANGRITFVPVEAQPTLTDGNFFNAMNQTNRGPSPS